MRTKAKQGILTRGVVATTEGLYSEQRRYAPDNACLHPAPYQLHGSGSDRKAFVILAGFWLGGKSGLRMQPHSDGPWLAQTAQNRYFGRRNDGYVRTVSIGEWDEGWSSPRKPLALYLSAEAKTNNAICNDTKSFVINMRWTWSMKEKRI